MTTYEDNRVNIFNTLFWDKVKIQLKKDLPFEKHVSLKEQPHVSNSTQRAFNIFY